jgi:hypothetical protein
MRLRKDLRTRSYNFQLFSAKLRNTAAASGEDAVKHRGGLLTSRSLSVAAVSSPSIRTRPWGHGRYSARSSRSKQERASPLILLHVRLGVT